MICQPSFQGATKHPLILQWVYPLQNPNLCYLQGILPSLIPWFLSNPTPLGISSCSGSTSTIWFRISHLFVSSDATYHALEPDNFLHTTFHQSMSWKLDGMTTSSPSPPPSVTSPDPRAAPSPPPPPPSCSSQLLNFKRGIKRDISAYPTLKDEKYYESFKRSLLVTARAHDREEILQPTFRPRGDADSLELLRLKNDFMYSVFNKCLLEQFILHFNEQFQQLDEVSPPEESLPYSTRLTLLQAAVHNIPELRMVENMEEIISLSSSTPGPTMEMITTSLYSKMLASDMIAISNLGPLQPLELPTSMNYLLTSMTTHIPRTTLHRYHLWCH